jgi:hypothetical protein
MSGLRVTAAALVAVFALPVRAEPPARDPVLAEAEFQRGWELLEKGDWPAACARFEASMALDPAVSTALRIAACREREGKLATAWYEYQQALKLNEELPQSAERRTELAGFARSALAALDPKVPRLRVALPARPDGTTVQRNGMPLPLASLADPIMVDAGEQVLEARAPGFEPARATVTAREGHTVDVELRLVPAAPPPPPPPVPPPPPQEDTTIGDGQRTAGLVTGGVGLCVLGVAAGLGIYTLVKVGESNEEGRCVGELCNTEGIALRDEARSAQTAGFVTLAIGGAALGAGIIVFFTAPEGAPAAASVHVAASGAHLDVRW